MPDLLIELFSEEIPARMQARAAADLKRLVTDGLVAAGLTYAAAGAFATPRRLVLAVEALTAQSRPVKEERKGPRTDAPDAAVEGFLRSTGLTRDQLQVREDRKAQVYFAVTETPGRMASEIVAEVLATAIRGFPWPKSMRWGAGTLRWVRPLHSILCLLTDEAGATVVPVTVDHLTAGDTTEGHRFMAPGRFAVTGFDDYRARLMRAKVMLDPAERADHIRQDAQNAAFAGGGEVVADDALLAEVAGLVEWPVVLMGRIDPRFLHLPAEVLQTSMRTHQKFFSVRNGQGHIDRFVTVANIETPDDGATILAGNAKVLSARLSDAAFFWDNDLREAKAGMAAWAEGLARVTFHSRLGSQAERVERIAALAREIAPAVGADPDRAERAARLAKLDLQSAMVGEFPELQGTMGRAYALAAGHDPAIADAVRDHYAPEGPSDAVPAQSVSVTVALADKLDLLTGFWAIGETPTGSKDPFALRRAALGVIRLILANDLTVDFHGLTRPRFHALGAPLTTSYDLLGFLHDRLKVFLKDEGVRHDVIDACLAMPGNDDLALLVRRARALSAVLATDDGANLVQGFRRANNIVTQAEAKDGVEYSYGADVRLAETDEERALFAALDTAEDEIAPAMKAQDFATAMAAMAALRAPVDAFLTAVQVNVDSGILRRNRLNLLSRIRATCAQVADLTKVEG